MTNQDSPLKLAHIEEYRKQKAQKAEPKFIVFQGNIYWHLTIEAETPRGRHVESVMVSTTAPFLRWRMKLAKRRLLKQWRIVCEMES